MNYDAKTKMAEEISQSFCIAVLIFFVFLFKIIFAEVSA